MTGIIKEICRTLYSDSPLVHAITNPISINQCANAILAVGARPICAEHPCEVLEVTASADALLLNLGNITDARLGSIPISAKTAYDRKIPFVLDLVGVSCSQLRRNLALSIIHSNPPSVIKGNYSEIMAICNPSYKSRGVDAEKSIECEDMREKARGLAKMHSCVILATGETDIVTDGNKIYCIAGGSPKLPRITGTGCMSGALCAAFLTTRDALSATICSSIFLGVCGKYAETEKGNGSFMVNLIDNLSCFSANPEKHIKSEDFYIEEF